MALNMKTLTQALAKASAVIEKAVTSTVQEVTSPRPLQDCELLGQVASGGPGLAWRINTVRPCAAASFAPYPVVSVWVRGAGTGGPIQSSEGRVPRPPARRRCAPRAAAPPRHASSHAGPGREQGCHGHGHRTSVGLRRQRARVPRQRREAAQGAQGHAMSNRLDKHGATGG